MSEEARRQEQDPSSLTTAQLLREIAMVRELTTSQISVIDARLDGMDKAVELLQKYPTEVDKSIGLQQEFFEEKIKGLEALINEKFSGIATQFAERDKRTEQLSLADKTAIAAALQAQKEAAGATNESNTASIAKSEAGFTKQIDQIGALIATTFKGQDEKVGDIKERLTIIEGRSKDMGDVEDLRTRITTIESRTNGAQMQKHETKEGWGYVFGGVGLVVGLVMGAAALVKLVAPG